MATTGTKQSSTDLSRSQRKLISSHWSEITRSLAPPGIAWEWSECPIKHRIKYRWMHNGLIRRAPDGKRWETTERLWLYVIDRAGDDETIGAEATGQQIFVDAPRDTSLSRTLCAPTSRTLRNRTKQVTLTGEKVAPDDLDRDDHDLIVENLLKDPTRPDDRAAAAHPGQTRLTRSGAVQVDADASKWRGPESYIGTRLSTPATPTRYC